MEQMVIRINNQRNASLLSNLLRSLDFVESIEINSDVKPVTSEDDFFALAGIWQDRDINQAMIREKAWPKQSS